MEQPASEKVAITKLLVQRREFWLTVIVLILAVVVIVLAVLYFYPELLSEIVDLYDDDPAPSYYAPRLLEPYEYKWEYPEGWPTVTPGSE